MGCQRGCQRARRATPTPGSCRAQHFGCPVKHALVQSLCSTPPCLPLLFCHPRPATRLTPPTTHPPHTHTRAQLTNAQFKRVKTIAGADFTDALIRKDVAKDLCKIASGINPTTGVPTRESLGCPP